MSKHEKAVYGLLIAGCAIMVLFGVCIASGLTNFPFYFGETMQRILRAL